MRPWISYWTWGYASQLCIESLLEARWWTTMAALFFKIPPKKQGQPASPACQGGILRVSRKPHPKTYHLKFPIRGGIPGLGPPPMAKVQCSRTNFHQQCCNRQAQGPQQSRKDTSNGEGLGKLVAQPLVSRKIKPFETWNPYILYKYHS